MPYILTSVSPTVPEGGCENKTVGMLVKSMAASGLPENWSWTGGDGRR